MAVSVVSMLGRVIQPNGAFRQSPYVDAVHWSQVTGAPATLVRTESPDPALPVYVSRDVAQRIRQSVHEVARLQLSLLALLTNGRFDGELDVLERDAPDGSTVIAVFDLLLLWKHICNLYGKSFPISNVRFTLQPISDDALDAARASVDSLIAVLTERASTIDKAGDSDNPVQVVADWAKQVDWKDPSPPSTCEQYDLIVNRNPDERSARETTSNLAPGGVLVLLASGTSEDAVELSRLRRKLLREDPVLSPVGPCGQEFGNKLPDCCDSCWPVRSEYVDVPSPVAALRVEPFDHGLEEGETDQVPPIVASWSYTLIERSASDSEPEASIETRPGDVSIEKSKTGNFRFVGAFRGRLPIPTFRSPGEETSAGKVMIKVCPANTAGTAAVVECAPESLSFSLGFGDRIDLNVASQVRRSGGLILKTSSPVIGPSHSTGTPGLHEFIPVRDSDSVDVVNDALDEIALRLLRFSRLREFQHVILKRILAGKSVLGIAATGGGKSECFILPAMVMSGLTIVVSPLKSLMMDQYQERICRRYNLGNRVTWINGDLATSEQRRRLELAARGRYGLLYLTPEQLEKQSTIDKLREADARVGLRFMAIDEAHCISQWGHDFRPSYLNTLRRMADAGLNPVRIALTATASPAVRADICQELGLDNRPHDDGGDVYIHSSNRPELNLITRVMNRRTEKIEAIVEELSPFRTSDTRNGDPGAAIVFMPWTQHRGLPPARPEDVSPHVTSMASYLERRLRSRVSIYHGGMDRDPAANDAPRLMDSAGGDLGDVSDRQRSEEQQAFIRGQRQIMVATKGFGMGIDKPDIRTVIHATPPGNLEAYVQEAGRAGRDGEPSNVVLYYSPEGVRNDDYLSDYHIQRNFLDRKLIRREDVRAIARVLVQRHRNGQQAFDVTVEDLSEAIIDYCNRRNFPQMEFRKRVENTIESADHAEVLDRGHEYQQWTEYLDRVLGELHSFASASEVADIGAFFGSVGKRFRSNDSEVTALSLDELRGRFGARYRAFPGKANARAKSAGRDRPSIDDWFGRDELVRPVGWNLTLGTAFASEDRVVAYVEAFCEAHEQRDRNARESYTRLLTDYLGLNPDGTRNPDAQPECLRSVMLGYLKTNEIVQDGNCRSCSNCVPDERFERYSLDERRNAVVRIDDRTLELLQTIEESSGRLPEAELLDSLFADLRRNTESSRSLRRYIIGWSGRILDEQPAHVAVRWLRLRMATDEERLEFDSGEVVGHLRSLTEYVQGEDVLQLWRYLERTFQDDDRREDLAMLEVRARLAQRADLPEHEANALASLTNLVGDAPGEATEDRRWIFERLVELHNPRGPLPDAARLNVAREQLARRSADESEAREHYQSLRASWTWQEVVDELRILELPSPPRFVPIFGLLTVWIEQRASSPDQIEMALDEFLSGPRVSMIDQVSSESVQWLAELISSGPFEAPSELVERLTVRLLRESGELDGHVGPLLKLILMRSPELPPEIAVHLTQLVLASTSADHVDHLSRLIPDDEGDRARFATSLASELPELDEERLTRWLGVFPVDLHGKYPELAAQVLRSVGGRIVRGDVREDLRIIAQSALWGESSFVDIHEHWVELNQHEPGVLGEYIQDCVEAEPPEPERADAAFSVLVERASLRDLSGFLIWAHRNELVRTAGRVTDAANLFEAITQWAGEHNSGRHRTGTTNPYALRLEFETWLEEHQQDWVSEMNPDDFKRILDLSLEHLARR